MSVQMLWFFVAGHPRAVHMPDRRTPICKTGVYQCIHGILSTNNGLPPDDDGGFMVLFFMNE